MVLRAGGNEVDDVPVVLGGGGKEMICGFQVAGFFFLLFFLYKSLMGGKGDSLLDRNLTPTLCS